MNPAGVRLALGQRPQPAGGGGPRATAPSRGAGEPGEQQGGQGAPLVRRVVANKCRNSRRRKWVADVSLGLPDQLTVVSAEDHVLRGADLRTAVARLRHQDRLVVVLYFYLDMPLEEVAVVAGSSVGATRARLYRAINKLRPDLAVQEALR